MHLLLLEAGPQHGAGPPLGLQLQLERHHLLGQLRHGLGQQLTETRQVGLGLSRLKHLKLKNSYSATRRVKKIY